MGGKPEGGGGTRVERQVGGRQGVGGGQLRPGVEAQQGRGAGGVAQRGGGRGPGRENISIFLHFVFSRQTIEIISKSEAQLSFSSSPVS